MTEIGNVTPRLPADPGGYALMFRLDKPIAVKPGKLGIAELSAGQYLYLGSALSGMRPRLARHLRRRKKRHWHIDALTLSVRPHEIWWVATDTRLECDWTTTALAGAGASTPVPGFGSSDCRCKSHLVHLKTGAVLERVYEGIVGVNPEVHRLRVPTRLTKRFLNTP
jgi:Uri superfamily endonuclease